MCSINVIPTCNIASEHYTHANLLAISAACIHNDMQATLKSSFVLLITLASAGKANSQICV